MYICMYVCLRRGIHGSASGHYYEQFELDKEVNSENCVQSEEISGWVTIYGSVEIHMIDTFVTSKLLQGFLNCSFG